MNFSHKRYAYVDPDPDQLRLYRSLTEVGLEIHEKIERELARRAQDQNIEFAMRFVLPRRVVSGRIDGLHCMSSSPIAGKQ